VSGFLILTALVLEATTLGRRLDLPPLRGPSFTALGRGDVRLAPVGPAAACLAERWARLAEGLSAPLVVSAGLCGALVPDLGIGDLVLPVAVVAPSGDRLPVDAPARERLAALTGGSAGGATLATSRVVLRTAAEKAALHAATGATAVDMESAAILEHASRVGWPALVVRGVSDDARGGVPEALGGLVTDEGRVRGGRALGMVLTRPRALGRVMALRRGSLRALEAVASALSGLIVKG
jgi:adenosylhomocysteine nucleosidase